jgi:hypothetical protein
MNAYADSSFLLSPYSVDAHSQAAAAAARGLRADAQGEGAFHF